MLSALGRSFCAHVSFVSECVCVSRSLLVCRSWLGNLFLFADEGEGEGEG